MKSDLIKAMQRNQLLDIMYIAKDGSITKRRIKIIKMICDRFRFTASLKMLNVLLLSIVY